MDKNITRGDFGELLYFSTFSWTGLASSVSSVSASQASFHVVYKLICLLCHGVAQKIKIEPRHEKTNVLVSDLVRHKPGCTATGDG